MIVCFEHKIRIVPKKKNDVQLNYCSDNTFDVGVLKLECTFKTDLKQKKSPKWKSV